MTFRFRVTLVAALAVAAGIVAASVVVYFIAARQLRSDADRDLRTRAAVLTAVLPGRKTARLKLVQWMIVSRKVEAADPGQPQVFLEVAAPRFKVDSRWPLLSLSRPSPAVVRRAGESWRTVSENGVQYRVLALPFLGGVVQIARPLSDVNRSLHNLRLLLLWVSLGGIGLATLLGALVSRAAVAPLRRLVTATDRVIATGNLGERVGRRGRDEVGQLSARFDEMLATLGRSLESQRQLVSDASHELRTPLASLRANLELLLSDSLLDETTRGTLRRDVRAELEALTTMMAELLDLARGEELDVQPEMFRLDRTVEAALRRVQPQAPNTHFEADLEASTVRAIPERVERAVTNLLDNARKWTPDGGTVYVHVRDGVVEVRDSGPGIDDDDRPLIFDRFYRAKAARGLPGAGLGLAIVKQIAEASGGSVSVDNAPEGGAIFRLQLVEI